MKIADTLWGNNVGNHFRVALEVGVTAAEKVAYNGL